MKRKILSLAALFITAGFGGGTHAQDTVTNAFDDLRRTGVVAEEDSPMRRTASPEQLADFLTKKPASGYYVFTEPRENSIRMFRQLPLRWVESDPTAPVTFTGAPAPGEYYVFQLAVYDPTNDLKNVRVIFYDLRNASGQTIPANTFTCFNQEGIDIKGKPFNREVNVEAGHVQALWCGVPVPAPHTVGTYSGKAVILADGRPSVDVAITFNVSGAPVYGGVDQAWRMSRMQWLNSTIGGGDGPTAPYIPVSVQGTTIKYLGGEIEIGATGLPASVVTYYDQQNMLDATVRNRVLADPMRFVIERGGAGVGTQKWKNKKTTVKRLSDARAEWTSGFFNADFDVEVLGGFEFDGFGSLTFRVKAKKDVEIEDMRLEVPYTEYASRYGVGMGRKGGYLDKSLPENLWDTTKRHDAIWLGNVNAGMNLRFKGSNFKRPLVNIYYFLGQLKMPDSWGNGGNGGFRVADMDGNTELTAFTGARKMKKGEILDFTVEMHITPVKPLDMYHHVNDRIYHSNSDVSANYIPAAKEAGANFITIHHKKDIYPYINYPFCDENADDFKAFSRAASQQGVGTRVYYTTRELTVKIPEIWALRSLQNEILYDGPGKDTRTWIHSNGPNPWLIEHFESNFIPAWYNAFRDGKYKGEMDISVKTTPDSRWNNYYLEGLHWMIKNYDLRGVYIDDSALDRETLKRARRLLDADGTRRTIDIHSWNHYVDVAGFSNSLHQYLELLPYVDETWIGEGFEYDNSPDFWLVEMAGIPFGQLSQTLDAKNYWRGMIYNMPPRLPWSGNPVPIWKLWDEVGMENAVMYGWWNPNTPVVPVSDNVKVTTYKLPSGKALVVAANWTEEDLTTALRVDTEKLGFTPARAYLPHMEGVQEAAAVDLSVPVRLEGKKGLFIILE